MNEQNKKIEGQAISPQTCTCLLVSTYCHNRPGKIITMADIAKMLQLSTSTVSRALSGSTLIGKNTSKKIQKAVNQVSYVINSDASKLRKLHHKKINDDKKPVTIFDIAKALNISTSTVSRSLLANKDVSTITRTNVLQIAAEMGYTPHVIAKRLGHRKKLGYRDRSKLIT